MIAFAATGCAPVDNSPLSGENSEEPTDVAVDAVTDLTHSSVKRQSIGNCWIYATVGWIESLRLKASVTAAAPMGEQLNISESYITYWHWYKSLMAGEVTGMEIETGGFWGEAGDIIIARGYMSEGDFIPEEANAAQSARQGSALAAINASIRSGMLSMPANRTNGTIVRAELDRAFGLRAEVVTEMTNVFGADGVRTLATTRANRVFVKRPTELFVGTARLPVGLSISSDGRMAGARITRGVTAITIST